MSMMGVTDFIVAGPPGHTTAGPAGHITAGPPGEVRPAPAASVPVSPAGHVPIDTSQARVPINTTPGWTMGPATGGSGGGGGGGGGLATGSTMVSVALNAPATGGDNHFTPGGQTPVHQTTGGIYTPSGNVPISTTAGGHFTPGGNVRPTPGYFHFTPGGDVRPTPGFSHFTPGGNVPIGLGGSHFVPGGHVPIAPKLGIDPNMPPARVNPPRPGRVFPHQMSNFHGPRFVHTQNWPSDEFQHEVKVQAWEPLDSRSTWEPPEKMHFVLSTDLVDTGALLDLLDSSVPPDPTRPLVENRSFDFSEQVTHNHSNTFTDVDASSVHYNEEHLPTFLFEDNRSNTYVLAAPERQGGALFNNQG